MTLLTDLDTAYAAYQNPDDIVLVLSTRNWIRGKDLTEEQHNILTRKRIEVAHETASGIWIHDGQFNCQWNLHWWNTNWHDYWLILSKYYVRGSFPS